MELNIG